jgi:hypothetical protein
MGKPFYIESFEIPESQDGINNNSAPLLVIPYTHLQAMEL